MGSAWGLRKKGVEWQGEAIAQGLAGVGHGVYVKYNYDILKTKSPLEKCEG